MPRLAAPTLPKSLAAAVIALAALAAAPAEAKPKKIVSNGCTVEQIQSAPAGQCIDKMQDDIMHNRPTYHALYCSSTGRMLCCEYDQAGNTVDHSCEVLNISRPRYDFRAPDATTLAPPQSLSEPSDGPAAPAGGAILLF
jgi:hypothetical protein